MTSSFAIRNATSHDLPHIMPVIAAAKKIMVDSGNLNQWIDGYPSAEVIAADISNGVGYVVTLGDEIVGYFAMIPSPEPTYSYIEGGQWLDDELPYLVVHRIASTPTVHGIFKAIIDFCFTQCNNVRIDTHRDNAIMQHNLTKHGFTYCGIIYLANGHQRLAYQRMRNE